MIDMSIVGFRFPWRLARCGVGRSMRLAVLGAVAVVVASAIIIITGTAQPLKIPQLLAATILTLAVVIQRINGIQRWLSGPKDSREHAVRALAQRALVAVCKNRTVSPEVLGIRVHVWEVPLWYRKLFPYRLRSRMKRVVKWKLLNRFDGWAIRPSLRRVAAVGLVNRPTSGIPFRKGFGIIGVCIASNDQAEFLTLDVSNAKYQRALRAKTESDWAKLGSEITHNISLSEAKKLAHLYGQVIAMVIQHKDSGEAIGCATISIQEGSQQSPLRITDEIFKATLTDLALTLATVLG
jgi:hypothetical protein